MDEYDRLQEEVGYWSSSSSSIGKNSDDDDDEGGENEVESPYKSPLDMMECLEEVLPIRRGISKFYKGKSKSFMRLMDSASLPMEDLGRPENACIRRRRNLLTHRICTRGGISKRPIRSRREGSSSGDDSPSSGQRPHPPPLRPRQTKGPFGNCVPVVDFDSPPCLPRNVHNIIC